MSNLNQYELSRKLGSTMRPLGRKAAFGPIGMLRTLGDALTARYADSSFNAELFTISDDLRLIRAFEDVRDGLPPDAVNCEPELRQRFTRKCRELGLEFEPSSLRRRLLTVRKNKRRYAEHGVSLSKSTRRVETPEIAKKHLPTIEVALVKMKYIHGVSIDEILIQDELAEELIRFAQISVPRLGARAVCAGALYLRKGRYIKKNRMEEIMKFDPTIADSSFSDTIAISAIERNKPPRQRGLFEVRKNGRSLYIGYSIDLQSSANVFVKKNPLHVVEGAFWHFDADETGFRYIAGDRIGELSAADWVKRCVVAWSPLFNWPVSATARAA